MQFSVFSNQFLLAALNRVINADTLEAARESKEILLNELGVIYATASAHAPARRPSDADREGDPALVSTTGTVDGGTFRFRAAHFEWLLRFGAALGLRFGDMGKRRHGDPGTLFFCDELFRLYGSGDYNEAMGASFAVENWAAAGFWKELIGGLERVKAEQVPALPLAFFTWHDKLEENPPRARLARAARVLRLAPVRGRGVHRRRRHHARRGADVLGRPVPSAAGGARNGGNVPRVEAGDGAREGASASGTPRTGVNRCNAARPADGYASPTDRTALASCSTTAGTRTRIP